MSIDIGKAAFSGFGLIGRRPLSVLVWGIAYMVVLGLPSLFVMTKFWPAYMQMVQGMIAAQAAGETPMQAQQAMMQNMTGMMQYMPMLWLLSLFGIFVRGVMIAAVLRAVLEPENKGFFYLRVGMQEVWQALLAFAMAFLLGILFFAAFIVGAILSAILAAVLGKAAVIGVVVVVLAVMVACIYIVLRFSLAPAMTFADKTFRLFESWKLTRGHVGALFAIVLILIVLVWVFEIIVGGVAFGFILANGDSLRAFMQAHSDVNPDPTVFMQTFWKTMTPIITVAVVVGSLLSGAAFAIFLAPFATVYKQLTAKPDAAVTPAA